MGIQWIAMKEQCYKKNPIHLQKLKEEKHEKYGQFFKPLDSKSD